MTIKAMRKESSVSRIDDSWLRAFLIGGLLVCICPVSNSQEPDVAAPSKDDVLDWVSDLDASSLSLRKQAEAKLVEAGPSILDWLPDETSSMTVEAKQRLASVREKLANLRTEAEVKQEHASVRLDDVTNLGEALEAISRDSGIEFEHDADESTPVRSVKAPLPFWHAVDLVLDAANLDINFYGGDQSTLLLETRSEERPPRVDAAAYTGVYRLEVNSVTSRRSLMQPDLSGLNISLQICWEPRLTPIGLTIPVDQVAGQLDDSSDLSPQSSGDTIEIATSGDIAFSEFYLPMDLPSGRPSQIQSLSGVIKAMLPGQRKKFELAVNETAASQTIDAMTFTIEEQRSNGPLTEMRVGVELQDAKRSLESHRHWIFENDIYLRRADGSRADHLGFEVYRQSQSGVGIGYFFDPNDSVGDAVLIYESPTAIVANEVPFVLQDIQLP